ncbi:MAG: hypothetical protein ACK4QW_08325 [Alphaproteobacteria bacterium]
MTPKKNPLKLNSLQLKTLTLLQEIARQPDFTTTDEATGETVIRALPHAHGNHFHIGRAVVMSADATGLGNPAVWAALGRKGLVRQVEAGYAVTAEGATYDTGLRDRILHGSDH